MATITGIPMGTGNHTATATMYVATNIMMSP